jgi:maleylacetate reductase
MHPNMQKGTIVFTQMDRVIFGEKTADAVIAQANRLNATRVFILASGTLHRETPEVNAVKSALGNRFAGVNDHMPAHSPRDAVVRCANEAREAGTDMLVTIGGGSVTDGGKAVTLCLEHGISDSAGMEPYRTVVKDGVREFPDYSAPRIPQVAIPTTLSGGEFNARAGVTDTGAKLKQSYIHPGLIPETVILDPAVTVHTPQWLWISTGIRAVDHAVETLCSIDANDYTDGTSLQALRLLGEGLRNSMKDPTDLRARQQCLMGAWLSMVGIVTGSRLGASHAIGHILGGSANVPHGHTSCVMLPFVLRYNQDVNAQRQAMVSEALGYPGEPAWEVVHELISSLEMPRSLRAVGIEEAQLPQLARNCMLDDWTFSNPKKIDSPVQIMEILHAAL